MSELSPEARGLVDDGYSVLRPSSGDRARIKSALAARLGGAAFLLPEQASAAVPKSAFLAQQLSTISVGVGVGVLALGGYFIARASSGGEEPPVRPPSVARSQPQVAPAKVSVSSPAA